MDAWVVSTIVNYNNLAWRQLQKKKKSCNPCRRTQMIFFCASDNFESSSMFLSIIWVNDKSWIPCSQTAISCQNGSVNSSVSETFGPMTDALVSWQRCGSWEHDACKTIQISSGKKKKGTSSQVFIFLINEMIHMLVGSPEAAIMYALWPKPDPYLPLYLYFCDIESPHLKTKNMLCIF